MRFTFTPLNEAEARAICSWHYEEPYAIYDIDGDPEEATLEMLDRRSPHFTVRDEQGEFVGFFSFGTSALPWDSHEPAIYMGKRTVPIGLGMRPDLTGKGRGLAFVNAGLQFAREQFTPSTFCLYVMTLNERAIRVYEKAGFKRVRVFKQLNIHGEYEFMEMSREARLSF